MERWRWRQKTEGERSQVSPQGLIPDDITDVAQDSLGNRTRDIQSTSRSTIYNSTNMLAQLFKRIPQPVASSSRACSSSSRCCHPAPKLPASASLRPLPAGTPSRNILNSGSSLPTTSATTTSASRPFSHVVPAQSSRIIPQQSTLPTTAIQTRGMKVRSSVRRFCDGCSVVRR